MAGSSIRYPVLLLVLTATGLFAGMSLLLTPVATHGLTAKYRQVHYGQTQAELEAVFGVPDKESHDITGLRTELYWQEGSVFVHVLLEPADFSVSETPVVQRYELLDFTPTLPRRVLSWLDRFTPHVFRR